MFSLRGDEIGARPYLFSLPREQIKNFNGTNAAACPPRSPPLCARKIRAKTRRGRGGRKGKSRRIRGAGTGHFIERRQKKVDNSAYFSVTVDKNRPEGKIKEKAVHFACRQQEGGRI